MSTKSNSSSINSRKSSNESNDEHEKASLNISKASNSNVMTVTASNEENLARLCHLKKWPHFQGYGFNLHAERSKMGQHIGKVDLDSPADLAGLKEGDRIIEVNNVNISNENHQQVVKRIRNGLEIDGVEYPDQVILLVVDSKADEYYKKLNVVPKNDMNNIIKLVTPVEQPPKPNEKKQETSVEFNNENISQRFNDALKTQSSTPAEASKTDESSHSNFNEKERKNSNTSNSSDSIVKTSKHKLNSSISSNSNKSANSISKEQTNYNKDNHKSNPIETQNEQRVSKNIGHKENSLPITSDSFKSSKVFYIYRSLNDQFCL
jgi:sodium/hydrogen exchange regulatory cofactor NHE-RF2